MPFPDLFLLTDTPRQGHHLPHTFKFKDYSPQVFRAVRRLYGVRPEDYVLNVAADRNYIQVGAPPTFGTNVPTEPNTSPAIA